MAGKRQKKEQHARYEIQQKAKMTREELGGCLLKGVRAEQLDTKESDAMTPKNRISRLSTLRAEKVMGKKFNGIPEEAVVGQLPPRWQRLLDADFTVNDWKNAQASLEDLIPDHPRTPKALLEVNQRVLHGAFWDRTYQDEDTMKLIHEAYKMGAQHANEDIEKAGYNSLAKRIRETLDSLQRIIDFLVKDHEERVNPILSLTPRELTDRIVAYFIECDLLKRFYTVPGLAFHMGFSSREELQEYMENNPESLNVYIIKRAFIYIESERVVDMLYGGGLMAGHKLDLATNFNYNDAGKKGEAQPSSTNITVNNNTLSMNSAPPKAASIEEWQAWYIQEQANRKKAIEAEEAAKEKTIDVQPS